MLDLASDTFWEYYVEVKNRIDQQYIDMASLKKEMTHATARGDLVSAMMSLRRLREEHENDKRIMRSLKDAVGE